MTFGIIIDYKKKKKMISPAEQEGMKDIIKIGKEINKMKKYGEKRRASVEFNTDLNKIFNKQQEKKEKEFREKVRQEIPRILNEAKEEGVL